MCSPSRAGGPAPGACQRDREGDRDEDPADTSDGAAHQAREHRRKLGFRHEQRHRERPGEGEVFDRGNRIIRLKAELGQLSVNEIEFDADFSVPPHRHEDHVDAFYVLDGEVEFTLESGVVTAGPARSSPPRPGRSTASAREDRDARAC